MTEFEEVPADSDQVLVAGPQGGHHFIVTARIRGLQPGDPESPGTIYNPTTRFTVWSEDGEQLDIDPPAYRLGYESAGNGMFVLPSGHIIQVREEEVAALYGGRVKVRVEVEDATGARATDERWVVAVEDTTVPDGDAGVPDAGPPAASVEIGTGDTTFEELPAESDLEVHTGFQGGHHVFLHARMMGLTPEGATTRFRVFTESGDRVDISPAVNLDYEDAGGGTYTLPYGPIVQIDEAEVDAIIGTRVRVTVELTSDGIQVTDQRFVRAVEP